MSIPRSIEAVAVLALFGLLSLPSLSYASDEAQLTVDPGQALAERYGLSEWPTVEQLSFTFRAELPDGRVFERPWVWRPRENTVTADAGTDEAVTFSLDDITDDVRDAHAKFINDSYWLVFPFQLVWSTCEVTDDGEAAMPISGKPARKLTVAYPDEGGYTPGDVYELFLDPESGLIAEWNFRKGGGEQGRPATWEQHYKFNGVAISLSHHGPDGSGFSLTFPKVEIETAGGATISVIDSAD